MTNADTVAELRFEPPAPGYWERDAVHFPRPMTRYWQEVHPAAFARGTGDFARFYGMLIDSLGSAYVHGFGYRSMVPVAEEEVPARFQRAAEVMQGKLWREQLRDWDETGQAGLDQGAPGAAVGRSRQRSPTRSWSST